VFGRTWGGWQLAWTVKSVSSTNSPNHRQGLTLRQAALIAGFAYLLNPVTYAESLYPKLVFTGNAEQTVQNISTHGGLFLAALFCYLINFIGDVVIAWALYFLLAPVNRALSLLTAWFQLVYTAVALGGLLNMVSVFRLLDTPDYLTFFGSSQLHAQVYFLVKSFQYDWGISMLFFAIHLVLLGYLIYRSGYIPKILGILLVIDGLAWVINSLKPYLFPNAHLGYLFIGFLGELFFMLWLLIRGWRIQEPATDS
jgi:Domain of unknown function (DUF4386)